MAEYKPRSDPQPDETVVSSATERPSVGVCLAPGARIAGRFVIDRLLGVGGMGEVYAAHDDDLGIPVALKMLRLLPGEDAAALWTLKQEVLLARAISHRNVARTFDVGRHEVVDGRGEPRVTWFLSMELLPGETLRERIQRAGPLRAEDALPIVAQLVEGLAAAHRAGIAHLDLKSANIMLVDSGDGARAVVTDFGLARTVREEPAGSTLRPLGLSGTPAYMAPEQIRGEAAGPAADIYALGVVLFELLTGTLPHAGCDLAELFSRRLESDAPSPRSLVPDVDAEWDAVILRCLERDPARRFDRVEEVIAALSHRSTAAGNLPAERDAFFGRAGELRTVAEQLAAGERLITLLGPGGMGKTRLAQQAARAESWPGGAWFCDLTESREAESIAAALATALGLPASKEIMVERVGAALAGRGPCLVLLDNFEQVVDHAEATVGRWLTTAPEVRFLVTSRERLRLRGESTIALEPLDLAPAVDLFVERAQRQRPGYHPSDAELERVRDLVRLLERLPLAIELAAARMRVLSLEQIADRLRDRFRVLGGGSGRHGSLRSVIDTSWEMLSSWERIAWAQCAVFEGGFTLEAAEAVVELPADPRDGEPPWLIDILQSLVDKSLLRLEVPEPHPGEELPEARFLMFVALQEYARARLEALGSDLRSSASDRHQRWFAAGSGLSSRDPRVLERDRANLETALRRALSLGEAGASQAARILPLIARVAHFRGPLAWGLKLGNSVLSAPLAPADRATILVECSMLEDQLGLFEAAVAHGQEAADLALARQDPDGEARGLLQVGNALAKLGRLEGAEAAYDRALHLTRSAGLKSTEAMVGSVAGQLLLDRGRPAEALEMLESTLRLARETGNRQVEGIAHGAIGTYHLGRGELAAARPHLEEAATIARGRGNRTLEATYTMNLGILEGHEGREDVARARYEAALSLNREMGNVRQVAQIQMNLGVLHGRAGRFDEARDAFERAREIMTSVGERRAEALAQVNIGSLLLVEGRYEEAATVLAQAERVIRELGQPSLLAHVLVAQADVARRSGEGAAAEEKLLEAEGVAREIGATEGSPLGQRLAEVRRAIEGR